MLKKVLKEVLKRVNLTQKSAQKSKFNSEKYSKKYSKKCSKRKCSKKIGLLKKVERLQHFHTPVSVSGYLRACKALTGQVRTIGLDATPYGKALFEIGFISRLASKINYNTY